LVKWWWLWCLVGGDSEGPPAEFQVGRGCKGLEGLKNLGDECLRNLAASIEAPQEDKVIVII
jgi:hypothetical protein